MKARLEVFIDTGEAHPLAEALSILGHDIFDYPDRRSFTLWDGNGNELGYAEIQWTDDQYERETAKAQKRLKEAEEFVSQMSREDVYLVLNEALALNWHPDANIHILRQALAFQIEEGAISTDTIIHFFDGKYR